jgi:hypothetical protein
LQIESPLPFPAHISDDRKALVRIVAGLFALLGFGNGVAPQRIARAVHRAIGLVLRPAESAVRRLIYLVSLSITARPAATRQMPSDIARTGAAKTRPCFALFDPRQRLISRPKTTRPRPRISFFGDGGMRTIDLGNKWQKDAESDGLIASAKILRRLEALKLALDDLPRQALRLKRALQRRSKVPRLKMQGPMRPGHPPGHRKRSLHEVDEVLRRCHWRAREALPP